MKNTRKSKSGQIALLLVFLLTGLVLFSLNVDLFKAARSKLRLQNIADASTMAVTRWQATTLNLVGDLNFAHLKAINDIVPADERTTNFIAGITALQRHLKAIGPLIGFDAANQLARKNGAKASDGMREATESIADSTDPVYASLIRKISANGIYAGIDNTKTPTDLLTNPRFYRAVQNEDIQELCELGGYHHTLPSVGSVVPSKEDMFHRGCIGYIGADEHSYSNKSNNINFIIDSLLDLSKAIGYSNANIDPDNLKTNKSIILSNDQALMWNTFDSSEWRQLPSALDSDNFPWIEGLNINSEHAIMGGSCTIRIEDTVVTTNFTTTTAPAPNADVFTEKINPIAQFHSDNIIHKEIRHTIVAQSAAKVFTKAPNGASPIQQRLNPALIIPVFSHARYVPFALAANGREAMADGEHVNGFPQNSGDSSFHQATLDKYHSKDFKAKASNWFANHEHGVKCNPPPPSGSKKRGGGTDRVP